VITIECSTGFDITATGVLGQYKENREIRNQSDGSAITSHEAWLRARNQQRNWETMNQIISLRCLPENIQIPRRDGDIWRFVFDIDSLAAVSDQSGDLEFLRRDAEGVPMILGLEEAKGLDTMIRTLGTVINTDFRVLSDKYQTGDRTQ
jgi:hypothetical protein